MASYLDFEGVYDPSRRFMFNNWSSEDFTQHFGAESAYNDTRLLETQSAYDMTIKAGDMRELGHFQAHICTKHFVNREMLRDAMGLTIPKERERAEMAVNNAILREPYEQKTLSEIKPGQSSSFMDKMRDEIRKEEVARLMSKTPEVKGAVELAFVPTTPEATEVAKPKAKKGKVPEFSDK